MVYVRNFQFPGCCVCVSSVVKYPLTELTKVYRWFLEGMAAPVEPTFVIRRHRRKLRFCRNGEKNSPRKVIIERGRIMPFLEREINRYLIEALGKRLLLHAAAVAHNGRAIMVPANALSGKSTLAAGLVERGCGYLTDELVIIHPRNCKIVPFPKALSLKKGSFALFEQLGPDPTGPDYDRVWYVDPEKLRQGSVVKKPTPIGWVILPRFESGAATRVEELTTGETVLGLFENTVNITRHKEVGLDLLIAISKKTQGYRLIFGDLDEACKVVLNLVGSRSRP